MFFLFVNSVVLQLNFFVQEAEADQSDDDEDTMLLKQKIKALQRVSTNSMDLITRTKAQQKKSKVPPRNLT